MNDVQRQTPILTALQAHVAKERVSLHVPGHKAGQLLPTGADAWMQAVAALDGTELPGLDDLYRPVGAIASAQALAARAFGSDEAYFLVGGSTAGNLAAILAVVRRGQWVIAARNCHESVWHALRLAGARVQVVTPALLYTGEGGAVYGPVTDELVRRAVAACPQAVAVVLTSPTYAGVATPLKELVQRVHQSGMVVVIDEAHGAHLPFHPDLPVSGIQAGADLVVQSTHKMTAALTQTGLLHRSGERVSSERVLGALRMVQTSSPSYPLLASIDMVRSQLAITGLAQIAQVGSYLAGGVEVLQRVCPGLLWQPDSVRLDPFKWLLIAPALGLAGIDLADALREQFGIFSEWADEHHVLCCWSYANSEQDVRLVVEALRAIARTSASRPRMGLMASLDFAAYASAAQAELAVLAVEAHWAEGVVQHGPLTRAVGQVACESLTVYPPGVPLVLPGETVTPEVVACVRQALQRGMRVDGVTMKGTLDFVLADPDAR